MIDLARVAEKAKAAQAALQRASTYDRQQFLHHLSAGLTANRAAIEQANSEDLANAEKTGVAPPMLDRLSLQGRVPQLVHNAEDVAALADPLALISDAHVLPNGLRVERRRVPLGVLMMIYEARPNATIEAAVLAVKSGNAIILKGGKEAERTNAVLGEQLRTALRAAGLPEDAVQVLTGLGHDATIQLLRMPGIDLCIPRGGEALIRTVRENARMPVLAHGPGVCHVYIDEVIDQESALAVALNAKLDRPSTCNASETMLVHVAQAPSFLPAFAKKYLAAGGELRADERAFGFMPGAKPAVAEDFGREFLANILAVKVVDSLAEAIGHIARYGTHHSDAICTTHLKHAERFVREVDSSAVFVNASTRLNDGSALGMGAELGISTSKFHSYGSMGLAALTIEKTVAFGDGHVRQ